MDTTTTDLGDSLWSANPQHKKAMITKTVEDKRDAYDEWAPTYDIHLKNESETRLQICIEASFQLIRNCGSSSVRYLDCGCGTGEPTRRIYEHLKGGDLKVEMVGVDFSEKMLEQARNKAVFDDLKVADMYKKLPVEEDSFDVVVAFGVFSEHTVAPRALINMLACVKKGGHAYWTVRGETWDLKEKEYRDFIAQAKCEVVKVDMLAYIGTIPGAYVTVVKK